METSIFTRVLCDSAAQFGPPMNAYALLQINTTIIVHVKEKKTVIILIESV